MIDTIMAAAVPLVTKVLISLGVGYITYQGVESLLDRVTNELMTSFDSFPVEAMSLAGAMGVDIFLNLVMAAWGVRVSFVVGRAFAASAMG